MSRLDVFKLGFLITVSLFWSVEVLEANSCRLLLFLPCMLILRGVLLRLTNADSPWDSYLIKNRIWTYPPGVVVGLTAWDIPAEELFFFVIQTFNTSLLYMILSKPTFHPIYLSKKTGWGKIAGQILFASAIIFGLVSVSSGGEGMYMGLILIWACPFLLFLW